MLIVIGPFCQGPAGIWDGKWGVVAATHISCQDIELWPHSVSMLVKWVAFLKTLHWPRILESVVSLMWSCSLFMSCGLVRGWFWKRLFLGTAGRVAQFQCWRFLLVQALIFGDLAGLLLRYFVLFVRLPGGIRRFVSCDLGADHCRLRHLGWEKCGHGLTSRPRESASEGFLRELLVVFGYSPGSDAALLGGELPLLHCSNRCACRVPTWGLPVHGHVQGLVAEFAGVEEVPRSSHVARAQLPGLVGGARVLAGRRILGGVKRVRPHRKTPSTPYLAGMRVLGLVQGSGRD